MIDILRAAAAGGATGLMTGHGSDHVLMASPTQRLELLGRGGFLADNLAWRRRHGSWPPLRGPLAHGARVALLRHVPSVLALRRHPPQLDLLQRDFVLRSGLIDDLRREGEQYGRDTGRHRTVRDTGSHRQQRRAEHLDALGHRAGVEFLNPFLDRRVMEVAASLPAEAVFAGGETKLALRRSMAGRLPEKVTDKRLPTARGGPYAYGLGAEGGPDIVRRLFADPALERIGVVDGAKLRAEHERFVAGDRLQLMRLISAVGGEVWLRRQLGEPLPGA
jgi:asparagine synthetase B (glutamine-hydrolysing)